MRVGAKEVAAELGVSLNTVYAMAQRGEIPVAFRVGPQIRFDLDEIRAWTPPEKPLTRAGTPRKVRRSKGVDWVLSEEQIERLPTDGFVYFLQQANHPRGLIKIGLAQDVERRLAHIQRMCPVPLVVLGTRPGGLRLEYRLHQQFEVARKHGEWFVPNAALRAAIREEGESAA